MAFRSPEYVQRNELVQFRLQDAIRAPANTQEQNKKGYKFHVTDRGIMLDWFNAFFEVRFRLDLRANGGDNADARTTIINGSHSLIKHMVIKSAGKIVYDTDNLHLVTFAKNLLEYSDDFGRSTAKNSLWYLDTDATSDDTNTGLESRRLLTANRAHVNTSIPLNRYSFFEELEGRLLPPMDLQFEIELTPDAEVLYGAVDTLRLVIDRFYLWVPRLEPKDALMTKFISEYQKPVNGNTSKKCTKVQILLETVVISESQLVLIKYSMFSSTSRDLRQMICQQTLIFLILLNLMLLTIIVILAHVVLNMVMVSSIQNLNMIQKVKQESIMI